MVCALMPAESGWENLGGCYRRLPPDGYLVYFGALVTFKRSADWMRRLMVELDLEQRPISMFGRQVLQPRLTAFHGEPGVAYRYSGQTMRARPWSPALNEIRARLTSLTGVAFNSVLCNLYRDGSDSMGWHADDEPELGRNPVIASLSLGDERRFLLKSRLDGERLEYRLGKGSLLLMAGDCQHHWLHQVPKTARPTGARMNLTFRTVFARRHLDEGQSD